MTTIGSYRGVQCLNTTAKIPLAKGILLTVDPSGNDLNFNILHIAYKQYIYEIINDEYWVDHGKVLFIAQCHCEGHQMKAWFYCHRVGVSKKMKHETTF